MAENVVDKSNEFHNKILLQEFYRLKQELSNQYYSVVKPEKIARFNELKNLLRLQKNMQDLEGAKEKIRQKIISADNSSDNSVVYTAVTRFKKGIIDG